MSSLVARLAPAPSPEVAPAPPPVEASDVVIVVDVSGSTKYPAGSDVDRDGIIGGVLPSRTLGGRDVPNTDPGDSVLEAELQAAASLIDSMLRPGIRVGVVSFAGDIDPVTGKRALSFQEDAWVEEPLGGDSSSLRAALDRVRERGSSGGTDMAAGLELAARELLALDGARSAARPGARKVIVFLSDGRPSLPFGRGNHDDAEDYEATEIAAAAAQVAGVRIDAYGLGPEATDDPIALTGMARVTGGTYTPVVRPGSLISAIHDPTRPTLPPIRIEILRLEPDSRDAQSPLLRPDGSFAAAVLAREGPNLVRVSAFAGSELVGSVEVGFVYERRDASD